MKKEKKRTANVHLRLTPEELARIERAAKRSGQTLSGWIRWVSLRSAK